MDYGFLFLDRTKESEQMSQLEQWAKETREAAANPEHEWDRKAIDWPELNSDSVVWEIGSFKGRWALQMAQKYNPRLYCFEPQSWACDVTRYVLQGYDAMVFNFALGTKTGTFPMGEFETDGCSFLRDTRQTNIGKMRNIATVKRELNVDKIDVCLINIEGYEYELIPYMIEQGILPRYLMIQFHGEALQDLLLRKLIETKYNLHWDYGKWLACWVVK